LSDSVSLNDERKQVISMQNNGVCDGERTGFSVMQTFTMNISKKNYIANLFLGLSLLGLCLFSLVACNTDPTCSTNAINAACPTSTKIELPPTKKPMVHPHPGGIGKHESRVSRPPIAGILILTPTPFLSDRQLARDDTVCYDELVLDSSNSTYLRAYNRLKSNLRDTEPFSDFIKNPNYTLYQGCWKDHQDQITLKQVNSSTWIVVLPMTKVDCGTLANLGRYLWIFRIQIVDNLPEIVAVTLVQKQA
jgi:hypothetical protein